MDKDDFWEWMRYLMWLGIIVTVVGGFSLLDHVDWPATMRKFGVETKP